MNNVISHIPMILIGLLMFIAGTLTFLAPCTLPVLPAYLAFSTQPGKGSITLRTLSFGLGMSLVFVGLGVLAGSFGAFISNNKVLIARISGGLFVLMGVFLLSGRSVPGITIAHSPRRTYGGSFLFGLIFAISWSGCIGPVLGFALVMAANTQTAVGGGILLLLFSLGLLLPLLAVSMLFASLPRNGKVWVFMKGRMLSFGRWQVHSTSLISGGLLILLGFIFIFGLDRYLAGSAIVDIVFAIEEKIAAAFNISLNT